MENLERALSDFLAGSVEAVSHDPICPTKGALVDRNGVVLRSNHCGRLYCPACWRTAVKGRARAIRRSQPERFVRYSVHRQVTPVEIRTMINTLHRRLRRGGVVWEAAWHVEPNRLDDGAHVHLWQHGSFVPRGDLLDLARRSGFDDVWIEAWEDISASGYQYGMKLAMDDQTRESLAYWNVGRLGGNTRNFWRAGRGGKTLTLKDAVRPWRTW